MRPPITRQPSKATQRNLCEIPLCLVRRALAPLTPKTLKMSAYGTLSPPARPQGSCQHRGRCPHPRSPRGRVQGKTSCTLTTERWVASTCKGQAASGCFASLDGFPAPSASDRFATLTEVERGQGRRSRAFLPLTPWSRQLRHRVRWLGFNRLPLHFS